ncbi:MAG TPA: polar amino acid ABC transporter permease [Chloroflexus aurantiacus]|jgi:general L-amino acid transport system permease protein|uniref:Polar amino acid ABC transporter, inner membrane subunit n=1 Tax=Chloroflexus aurantiacus (strain ATCC 29366 / DSM 635 / J-10-fl) TaxID=324602 RepID=A9WID5_CHLAA|nr:MULTISPECIES: ABC transporter permease subunit [Chloroflexus]ABY36427.1 polar amino acid ABC transporter, inner membrane subunit [Chloroflexus aurantiacus J-10-fl]RMG52115.1 MAG: ABC transporter permease subunit [Chloroflexota bacterium]HBW66203.1 polar amino acid ABC transporter permease [Chloroflexus aurantiacus]
MAVGSPSVPPGKINIPFYRDTRIIAIIVQVVFAILVIALVWFLYSNMINGLRQANLLPTFSFLSVPAGFPISESVIEYDPSMTYGRAFIVGILNTVRVAVIGIILATLLGLILGIARLSDNWLLRNVALVYVEIVRNVPLLLQLIFWFSLTRLFPRIQESIDVGGLMFLHNRGITLAWPQAGNDFDAWMVWVYAGIVIGIVFYVVRRIQFVRRDRPGVALPYALLIALGVALLGFLVTYLTTGVWPVSLSIPVLQRFNFDGGITVTNSFAALLIGLVIYTAVFIGEIVRSGILAVSKGQREAARALGLTPGQTMRLVILPQALRVIIPPLTSQYLNLTKNSSLAIAIAYPDLFYVANTINNQTGQAVPVILMLMASYLSVSLLTSLFMNWYNRRIQLVER